MIDQSVDKNTEPLILVKLRTSNMKKRPTITDVDRGIYTLSCNEKALIHYIERLEKEKQDAVVQAKEYLAKGMRSTVSFFLFHENTYVTHNLGFLHLIFLLLIYILG